MGGAIWLFLAAVPALADGGPHVAAANSGSTTLASNTCAGCHRAHTAQGQYLLAQANEEALCLSCHGSTGTGATTDVLRGLQYTINSRVGGTPILGALRDGGFEQAAIDSSNPMRLSYVRNNIGDVSTRPKVGVLALAGLPTPQNVNSAHIDLTPGAGDGIADNGIAWGNGTTGTGKGSFTLECTSCHNPHGNGQYRILNPIPTDSDAVAGAPVNIASTTASNERITTTTNHGLKIGSRVTIAGNTGTAPDINGTFTVASVPSVTTFTLGGVNITAGTTTPSGTATAQADVIVTDSPLGTPTGPGVYPTKNYTVLQVKGTQGTDASYMLYASDVLDARGANTKGWVAGDYSATGGDYLHRSVPWNPGVNAACDPTLNPSSTGNFPQSTNATNCASANDAPNGRPATWTTTSTFGPDNVAFNDQITAWCSACHTRYYSNRNPNPGTLQGSPAAKVIIMATATDDNITTGFDNPNLAVGDQVSIAGNSGTVPSINGSWYVVAATTTGSGTSTNYFFKISATSGGTALDITTGVVAGSSANGFVTRTNQATPPIDAASWWFPRPGDDTFKYQHSTTTNRACTTCHVAHGSNAALTPGGFAANVTYPDGTTTSLSSRLLKVDNRGTCQACHDPTGTILPGTLLPSGSTPKVP
jgi:predicted CXXCH cytochrome family protein